MLCLHVVSRDTSWAPLEALRFFPSPQVAAAATVAPAPSTAAAAVPGAAAAATTALEASPPITSSELCAGGYYLKMKPDVAAFVGQNDDWPLLFAEAKCQGEHGKVLSYDT